MRFSDAKGRKVVSTASAATVGRLDDCVIDPASRSVAALVLKKTSGRAHMLPWPSLEAFGEDAVMVASEDAVVEPDGRIAELSDKRFHQHGKRVLSTDGVDLGKVTDFEFDPETGALAALVLDGTSVEGTRLRAVGSYAVIVDA